jgi:hypothetical protein
MPHFVSMMESPEAEGTVRICHQATTGEDTADRDDLVCTEGNCGVCELAMALKLLVVTIRKCSINLTTNP